MLPPAIANLLLTQISCVFSLVFIASFLLSLGAIPV